MPPDKLDAVAQVMVAHAAVSHCYDRPPAPNWQFNLYTMIHTKTRDECEQFIGELAQMTSVTDYKIMYTKKVFLSVGF